MPWGPETFDAVIPFRRQMRLIRWGLVITLLRLHLVMKAPVWALISRVDLMAWFALLAIISVATSEAMRPAEVPVEANAPGDSYLASVPNTVGA